MQQHTPFRVRQGDVLVMAVAALTPDRVRADRAKLTPVAAEGGRTILAHGEVTGHAHALPADAAHLYGPSDDLRNLLGLEPRDRVLVVETPTALTHEEHSAIALAPGAYVVRRQREWTDAEEPIQVAD